MIKGTVRFFQKRLKMMINTSIRWMGISNFSHYKGLIDTYYLSISIDINNDSYNKKYNCSGDVRCRLRELFL